MRRFILSLTAVVLGLAIASRANAQAPSPGIQQVAPDLLPRLPKALPIPSQPSTPFASVDRGLLSKGKLARLLATPVTSKAAGLFFPGLPPPLPPLPAVGPSAVPFVNLNPIGGAVNNGPSAAADADLGVLSVTSRKEGGKTILTALIQCEPGRNFAGARKVSFTRTFVQASPNEAVRAKGGVAHVTQTLASFSLSSLPAGGVSRFQMDATSFRGEQITVSLSPGDRNSSNDSKTLRVPSR